MQFLIEATKTLLRFHKNLVEVSVFVESEQSLNKIWAEIVTLTARNCTRIDMGFKNNKI